MIRTLLFLVSLLFSIVLFAQKRTVSGYIEDARSAEKLIGANVYDKSSYKGTSTNVYGFFSITLPSDSFELIFSYVGYQPQILKFNLFKDTIITIRLNPAIQLKEVEVSAEKLSEKIQERSQMSMIEIPMEQIKSLPVLLGERDVLKVIQLLPGVQSGGEGTSGLYVRGGGPDQNLILLDGVPVYNASHLFGFFSVFNPDAINSVQLIKGGFPARYGGRLSSVIDIRMKEGNLQDYKVEGSIGIVASKLTVEGPIKKDKASFIISGRRTYIDILAQPFIRMFSKAEQNNLRAGYYFYDLNAKVNYRISEKDHLFISSYMGNDKAYFKIKDQYQLDDKIYTNKIDANLGWGNITTALRWNRIINSKLFFNTTLTYSKYAFLTKDGFITEGDNQKSEYRSIYNSGIYDLGMKVDFDFVPNTNHYIKFGLAETYHTFIPGISAFKSSFQGIGIDTTFGAKKLFAHETGLYIEDDWNINSRLKANLGLHFSTFILSKKQYYSLQPRLSARYMLNNDWSVKASYAQMAQFLHLLSNATIGLPTDLWLPVTDTIPPQYSKQWAAGMARTIKDVYELSIEGYYKTMYNLLEYKDGASFFNASGDWQQKVEIGRGWSYGAEFLIQKKKGRFSGWIGYTLSWTYRQFQNLNFGRPFPYRFDRRHDVGIALTYQLRENIDMGLVWVYGTGNAITLATETYLANPFLESTGFTYDYIYNADNNAFFNYTVDNFQARNDFRMPPYHRLDLGINFHKKLKRMERTWSLGLYNAYSRRNPFYLYIGYNKWNERVIKQVALFPIIPSLSYSFKF
ncbi:MAG: TonB-dependent receptor [Bacteroidia bacterium]